MDDNPYKAPAQSTDDIAMGATISARIKFIRWFLVGAFIIYPVLFAAFAIAGQILAWFSKSGHTPLGH